MKEQRTIGELAHEAGIPTSTVRYYERSGLLEPADRTETNYRLYGPREIERLRFIRAAQATGFTLSDIKSLLDYRDGLTVPCREIRVLVENRLSMVAERVREYRHIQKVLKSFLEECLEAEQDQPCHVIDKLKPRNKTT